MRTGLPPTKDGLLIIDGDNIHFEESPEDFRKITDMIDSALYGLFPIKDQK